MVDILNVLHHFHAAGHVHRDIKPENIKFSTHVSASADDTRWQEGSNLSRWGLPFLLDLGLAKNTAIEESPGADLVDMIKSATEEAGINL